MTLYSGFNGDGINWGTYDVGSYTCCLDNGHYTNVKYTDFFGNDNVNSIVVNANNGYDCIIRLYAAPNWYNYGQDWVEYKISNGNTQIINSQSEAEKKVELYDAATQYTVWNTQYSQVSWVTVTAQSV